MSLSVSALPSGLRLATDAMPGLETASVGVWVDSGARSEPLHLNGVSHLLEHMAFKGTRRRTARRIAEEIEGAGGHINAYTSREHTAYFARVLKDDVATAIDVLADILQNSVLDEDELARERQVVVQEIGEARDTPDDWVFDRLQEVAFPDQPLGRPVLGTSERVSGFRRGHLAAHMAAHYTAPGMVVSAAGAVDHDSLRTQVEAAFGALPSEPGPQREPARFGGGESVEARNTEQVHVALAFPAVSHTDPDTHAVQVLSTVLGGGMSSRLFQEAREKRGLAYSIFSFAQSYDDSGLFGIYAAAAPADVPEVLDIICGELLAVAEGLAEDEVARARAQHKAGLLMALESSSARCEQLARQLQVFGRPVPPTETGARIDAVDTAAVARVARRIASAATPALALVGPRVDVDYGRLVVRFG